MRRILIGFEAILERSVKVNVRLFDFCFIFQKTFSAQEFDAN